MAPYAGQYRNTSDLFQKVLEKLGVLSTGQPVDPEDLAIVSTNYDSILRKLGGLEIIQLSSYDVNGIPGPWFMDLAAIIAGEVAQSFGFTGQDLADIIDLGLGGGQKSEIGAGMAARSLKQMNRLKPTLEPARVDYF